MGQLVLECLFDAMGSNAVAQNCCDTSGCLREFGALSGNCIFNMMCGFVKVFGSVWASAEHRYGSAIRWLGKRYAEPG